MAVCLHFRNKSAIWKSSQTANLIKQIKNTEESRETHGKLNFHLKDTKKGSIDHVLIPIGEDPKGVFGKKWKKISDEDEVEGIILERNEKKLRESKISPFATTSKTSLSQGIGHMGDGSAVEEIVRWKRAQKQAKSIWYWKAVHG